MFETAFLNPDISVRILSLLPEFAASMRSAQYGSKRPRARVDKVPPPEALLLPVGTQSIT